MSLKALLPILFVFSLTSAEVPSFLHVCGHKSKEFNNCVKTVLNNLNEQLGKGIPELGIEPFDLILVKEQPAFRTNHFVAVAQNVKLQNLSKYDVKKVNVDLKNTKIELEILFTGAIVDAKYNVSANILVAISGVGPIHVEAEELRTTCTLSYKLVQRKGKTYVHVSNVVTKIEIHNYNAKFEFDGGANPELSSAINVAINDPNGGAIDSALPLLQQVIGGKILEMANKVFQRFTYDELFPDRE